jgi:hypothetical protein
VTVRLDDAEGAYILTGILDETPDKVTLAGVEPESRAPA